MKPFRSLYIYNFEPTCDVLLLEDAMQGQYNNAAYLFIEQTKQDDTLTPVAWRTLSESNPTITPNVRWIGPIATAGGGSMKFGTACKILWDKLQKGDYDTVTVPNSAGQYNVRILRRLLPPTQSKDYVGTLLTFLTD